MDLKLKFLKFLLQPKKVHGLPGRLRVHIPFLLKVDSSRKDLARMVSELLQVPDPIKKAEAALPTGNVLIQYDSQAFTEDEVFDYVKGLLEIVLRNRGRIQDPPPEKIPELTKRLKETVQKALGQRLTLDVETEVSDDVLA